MVAGVDLVVVRADDSLSVFCPHRGALLADGAVSGDMRVCGLHGYACNHATGVNRRGSNLQKFNAWVKNGQVLVGEEEIADWAVRHPQPYRRDAYQGEYQEPTGTKDEPHVSFIRKLADEGLSKVGHHGPAAAMGVPRDSLPKWDELQFDVAQLHKVPLLDDEDVGTDVVIGPRASKPLQLDIPLLVSDMSFGALSEEAKVALSKGAELAGTGICMILQSTT